MNLEEILPALTAWFSASEHKKRTIKGGGDWWYLPHTTIRDRLNAVCPGEWQTKYTLSHQEPDGDPVYFCELTICGVTKTGIGDKSAENSPYGTPSERSFRKAFVDACEQFGIAAYLDDQKGNREEFARYMHKHGNSQPATQLQNERRTTPKPATPNPPAKPFGQSAKPARQVTPSPAPTAATTSVISQAQLQRFWTIARGRGYSDAAVRCLIEAHGFSSSKEITVNAYETVCRKAEDPEYAEMYNSKAEQFEQQMALSEPGF